MTDNTPKFLQAIADRTGYFNVTEVHLFSPLKQGGQESAVAVIATTPETTTRSGQERHVIYTARYRATLKGPDRGKWEFDLKAEADATLITVDEVVRGVGMRAGDASEVRRFTGDEFRELVPAPPGPELEPALPENPDNLPPDIEAESPLSHPPTEPE